MKYFCFLFFSFLVININAQNYSLSGYLLEQESNQAIPFANVYIEETKQGTVTDESGYFELNNIQLQSISFVVSSITYGDTTIFIDLKNESIVTIRLSMSEKIFDPVVVTGTKTFQNKVNSPVIVQVIDDQKLSNVQACNIADGLKFQSGIRVETDCQTCNYTQLRINGLGGNYSQILINGRPIFNSLNALYGLEQIPSSMVARIETVKGGGSALYGSNAIGGTVNIITNTPKENAYQLQYLYQSVNLKANDHQIDANTTLVSKNKKIGNNIFANYRYREFYDHNNDNFSELPTLKILSLGNQLSYQPKENQKFEISLNYINEYRFGGEMLNNIEAHLTQQAEERQHHVFIGSLDYQINLKKDNSFIAYIANQTTKRTHYTGIFPDDSLDIFTHLQNPPYGNSFTYTINSGLQYNHEIKQFLGGSNLLSVGIDVTIDDVFDEIEAYNYLLTNKLD